MMLFDGMPQLHRQIEAAVGVPEIAALFMRQGITEIAEAEREYRRISAPAPTSRHRDMCGCRACLAERSKRKQPRKRPKRSGART